DLRIRFVADVDDARHIPRRQTGRARGCPSGHVAGAGPAFVRIDQIRLALDEHGYRVLVTAAVAPHERADHLDLRIGLALLHFAHVRDDDAVVAIDTGRARRVALTEQREVRAIAVLADRQ